LVIKLCFQSSNVAFAGNGAGATGASLADDELADEELAEAAGAAGVTDGAVSGCGVAVLHAVRTANRLM
jgi:hypothetical protein